MVSSQDRVPQRLVVVFFDYFESEDEDEAETDKEQEMQVVQQVVPQV